jgi:UDP-N-acetylmuramoyl-tripeptide--D-alanyl-D-alanine ligase
LSSVQLHREAGQFAAEHGKLDWIIGVAGAAAHLVEGAVSAGFPKTQTRFLANSVDTAQFLQKLVEPGDLVLIKGSRGVQMERIVDALVAKHATPGEFSREEVKH